MYIMSILFLVTSALIDKQICEAAVQECNAEQDDERYGIAT
jgi:hypothetical protein